MFLGKNEFKEQIQNKYPSTVNIEIWSDVMCPFCYIGKRRLEKALNQFEHLENIDLEWKSFQLNPDLETQPGKSVNEHLAESKGWSQKQAEQMNKRVTDMAAEAGLEYHLENAVVANSFDAHRFVQFAKSKGRGDAAEEALFKAYFTDGKNTGDHEVLVSLGEQIGLNPEEIQKILQSNQFSDEVQNDILQSRKIGIRGVPFFLFNDKYAVSGAQSPDVFLNALQKSWNDWKKEPKPQMIEDEGNGGASACGPDGSC